LGKYSFRTIL